MPTDIPNNMSNTKNPSYDANTNSYNKKTQKVANNFFKQRWSLANTIEQNPELQNNPQPIINNSSGAYTHNKAALNPTRKR